MKVRFYLEKRNQIQLDDKGNIIQDEFNTSKQKIVKRNTGDRIKKNIPILVSLSWSGKRIKTNTRIRIDEKYWVSKNQRVKPQTLINYKLTGTGGKEKVDLGKQINDYLDSIETNAKSLYLEAEKNGKELTVEEVKEKLRLNNKYKGQRKDFFSYYDDFIRKEGKKNDWSLSTVKKFNTLKNHLENFAKTTGYKIEFESINSNFYDKLLDYFRKEGHLNPTIDKNIKFLKWFLRWSFKNKLHSNSYFEEFKYKPKEKAKDSTTNIVALSLSELKHLASFDFDSESLSKVRDVFVFGCLTSLRYSDLKDLKKSQIKGNKLEYTSIKTGTNVIVPLNSMAKEILNRYKNLSGDEALPVISNQKMNDYLKIIGDKADLNEKVTFIHYRGSERITNVFEKWQKLSTHSMRRTFISVMVEMGFNRDLIKKISGHSDYKVMESYVKVHQKDIDHAMTSLNDVLIMVN